MSLPSSFSLRQAVGQPAPAAVAGTVKPMFIQPKLANAVPVVGTGARPSVAKPASGHQSAFHARRAALIVPDPPFAASLIYGILNNGVFSICDQRGFPAALGPNEKRCSPPRTRKAVDIRPVMLIDIYLAFQQALPAATADAETLRALANADKRYDTYAMDKDRLKKYNASQLQFIINTIKAKTKETIIAELQKMLSDGGLLQVINA